ncbi:MAG TPA: peptidoglycan DD-metalloendopeptidase family protein [Desulfitobacteriaceae bacterium]|nr:peptidoglycan DD-metalloendopeptidase family protein [Desulfitobacteriaceae bacterium]
MSNRKFRLSGLVCILSLVFLSMTVSPSWAGELEDAVQKQNEISAKQQEVQGVLDSLTYTADKINAELKELQNQINDAQKTLGEKQTAFSQVQSQIKTVQGEIEQNQQQLEERRQVLGLRVKGIYEDGQISYLGLLFESSNLGDFITRIEYLSKLVANDQKLLQDIKVQQEKMQQQKEDLEVIRNQSAQLLAEATAAEADLKTKKQQQQTTLADNKKSQQAELDENARLQAESNTLRETIRKMQVSRKGGTVGSVSNWPVPGRYEISSPFGWRTHPITGVRSLHTGIDIPAPTGTALHAVGAGEVIYAGWYGGYGNAVVIDHGKGVSTLYAHQSRLAVSDGQQIAQDQVIGYVGSTGFSTGPHLHFEVRINGNPTDPLQYFR